MRQSADLTDGVQDAGPRLVMCSMHQCDVRILTQYLFHPVKVGKFINREGQINVRQSVELADLHCAGTVSAVVDHQHLAARRQEGVEADVDIERSGAAEQHGGVHVRIGVNNPEQITAEIRHHIGKLALARADIRHHLRQLDRVGRGGGSGVEQYIPLYFHIHGISSPARLLRATSIANTRLIIHEIVPFVKAVLVNMQGNRLGLLRRGWRSEP